MYTNEVKYYKIYFGKQFISCVYVGRFDKSQHDIREADIPTRLVNIRAGMGSYKSRFDYISKRHLHDEQL